MKQIRPSVGIYIQIFVAFLPQTLAQNAIAYASNPLMNVDSLSPSPELKTMLLHNLNKHSDGGETLETLASSKSHSAAKHLAAPSLPISLDLFKVQIFMEESFNLKILAKV